MNLIVPSLYTSLQLLVVIGIGYIAARKNLVPETFRRSASIFLVNVALPLYFFAKFAKTDLSTLKTGVMMPVYALCILLIGLGLGFLVMRWLPFSRREKNVGIAMCGMGNAGFMPLTLIEAFPLSLPLLTEKYGLDQPAMFVGTYLILYSPFLWSVGNALVTGSREKGGISRLVSPPIYGLLAGLLIPLTASGEWFFSPNLPFLHIHSALDNLGSVILPLVLFNLGMMIGNIRLHTENRKRLRQMLAGVALVRFLLIPGCFYLAYFTVLRHIHLHPAILFVLFLETHIPPATNLSTMALKSEINEDLTAYTLLVTYLAYILVLPAYLYLFMNLA